MATILLVDDDTGFRESMKEVLEDASHKVIEAFNGNHGLESYRQRRGDIDLVITDVLMPDCDGLEMLSELRKEARRVKVIVISGGGRIDSNLYTSLAENMDADQILKKPVSINSICTAIDRVLLS